MPFTFQEIAAASVPTPAANKQTMFLDTDGVWKTKDEVGAVDTLEGAEGALTYQNHGNTGATETVTASTADIHRLVFDAATVTITLAGAPASGTPGLIRLLIFQDATGGRLASWPGSVTWRGGVAPTLQTAANALDVIDLLTVDGGTTWYGTVAGIAGATGATGVSGGAITIGYTFSTTTTDADPGNGTLRLNQATQNTATVIRADLLDSLGVDWTAVLDTFDDSTNTVKGHIRLFKTSDLTKWLLFTVSAVASPAGYRNVTVAVVGSSGANPFANSDAITLTFERAGDAGSAGTVVASARAKRTAGDVVTNSTTWANFDTGLDLTIAAASGDVLEVNLSAFCENQAVNLAFDAATIVSAAPVNYVGTAGGASDSGVMGWFAVASAYANIGTSVQYVVQAGDISGGNVVLRLRYKSASATNRTVWANTNAPVHFSVKNLKQ
jgi:hypothetical protein